VKTNPVNTLRLRETELRRALADELSGACGLIFPNDGRESETVSDLVAKLCCAYPHATTKIVRLERNRPLACNDSGVDGTGPVVACLVGQLPEEVLRGWLIKYYASRAVSDALCPARPRLRDLVLLLSSEIRIVTHSFAHGEGHYYRYRLAEKKLGNLPKSVGEFFRRVPQICPNELFASGPRASSFEAKIGLQMGHAESHRFCVATQSALSARRFKSAHEDVEKFCVECEGSTVAAEVPVWLEEREMKELGFSGESDSECLTGHIDIVSAEPDGRVGIWDFKPNAGFEKTAHIQLYLYALMLSRRTGIGLHEIRCGYFDEKDAYWSNAECGSFG
jgi:hypothetical protein